MNPGNWIALLGVGVALLGVCVPVLVTVMLRGKDQHRAEIRELNAVINKKTETIDQLKEANLNYRFALAQLGQTAESVVRLTSAFEIPQPDGGHT